MSTDPKNLSYEELMSILSQAESIAHKGETAEKRAKAHALAKRIRAQIADNRGIQQVMNSRPVVGGTGKAPQRRPSYSGEGGGR